jgi:hypothetical protein
MSGNGSVRKKVDLICSVASSIGDSALEGDRECVQGWFRALCLSNTSRTPPCSGLSNKRKGIYEASRCQARSTRLVHSDTAAWRPQEGRLTNDAVVHEQFPSWRRRAWINFEPLALQSIKEPPPRAGNRRSDHQLEFVDDACGQQRLSHRDAGVDADVTAGLVLTVVCRSPFGRIGCGANLVKPRGLSGRIFQTSGLRRPG